MTQTKKVFEENFNLLEVLARDLQNGKISVDELVPKMKEATQAMKICKDVLKKTRIQLNEIESELQTLLEDE